MYQLTTKGDYMKNVFVIGFASGWYAVTYYIDNVYQDTLFFDSLGEATEAKSVWTKFLREYQ